MATAKSCRSHLYRDSLPFHYLHLSFSHCVYLTLSSSLSLSLSLALSSLSLSLPLSSLSLSLPLLFFINRYVSLYIIRYECTCLSLCLSTCLHTYPFIFIFLDASYYVVSVHISLLSIPKVRLLQIHPCLHKT